MRNVTTIDRKYELEEISLILRNKISILSFLFEKIIRKYVFLF